MQQFKYPKFNQTVYQQRLTNGLLVTMLPMEGFHKTYAVLSTEFGSIDNAFVPVGKDELLTLPDGVAHFLEHKMFEKADHDAFDLFGRLGADANAFTSFTQTRYLFSTTSHLHENLDVLLDFVQDPYFTEQTVAKEKGIIGQEITMYNDDPGWRLYLGMLGNLYPNDPMRIDIAGTQESIQKITAEMLYDAYRTFYQPANMNLFIAGKLDVDQTLAWVEQNQAQKHFDTPSLPKRLAVISDPDANDVIPFRTLTMAVERPKVMVGLRGIQQLDDGKQRLLYKWRINLLLAMLFDETSANFLRLYDAGIIDDSFNYNFEIQRGFHLATFSTDTDQMEQFSDAMIQILKEAPEQLKAVKNQFEDIKHAMLGRLINQLDSPENIAVLYGGGYFDHATLLDEIEILRGIEYDELTTAIDQFIKPERLSVYQIVPPTK
ncbi:EF-P 5-aminopentanol modification-associated protein YfmH [Limosilactobacillus mucosae]